MKLILCDTHKNLCDAWRKLFAQNSDVEILHGRFEDVAQYGCMVSPANSFGLMDGGIDAAITKYFGKELMQRVQARIMQEYCGEQPVGTSIIVPTGNKTHPWLAHTPTMRVPRIWHRHRWHASRRGGMADVFGVSKCHGAASHQLG